MTIGTEITRIKTNIENAYTALGEKGATMPEVQNSDNLAETVGSVSTGGGGEMRGHWAVPPAYTKFDKIMEEDTGIEGLNYTSRIGFIISNRSYNLSFKIYQSNSQYILGVKTSDGKEYTCNSDKSNEIIVHNWDFEKDFENNYRWIIVYARSPYNYNIRIDNKDGTEYGGSLFLKETLYAVIDASGNKTHYSNYTNYLSTYGGILESFKFINGIEFIDFDASAPGLYYQSDVPNLKYIPSMEELGNPPVTITSIKTTGQNTIPNLPYGMDLSTVTSDISFGRTAYPFYRNIEAYVTIPPVNIKMNSDSYGTTTFSKDNWAYIAKHAPSVTDKTITMGAVNIAICGGEDSDIITTFKNKGWTVT